MIPFLLVSAMAADEDPRLWLEDVDSEEALTWVRGQNESSTADLTADPSFSSMKDALRTIYDSNEKIPYAAMRGEHVYNFWRDADHVRGIWRRTTLASYKTDAPEWETVLDLDKIAEEEGENWVWKGSSCLYPDYTRCIISLSRGGADATVPREFDTATKAFVKGGFEVDEAKTRIGWIDADTVYIGTDFGEGSLTDSGYPRIVKRWRRGTPLSEAETVFEGEASDISVGAWHDFTPEYEADFVYRGLTFYTNELYEVTEDGLVQIDKQEDSNASVHKGRIYFELRSDWTVAGETYTQGSLIVSDYKKYKKGRPSFTVLFEPTHTTSLQGWSTTRDHLVLNILDNVQNRIEIITPVKKRFERSAVEGLPTSAQISAWPVDEMNSNALWFDVDGYLTPGSLWLGEVGGTPEMVKKTPEWFDASTYEVTQHFAVSTDNTKIPYFQVAPKERGDEPLPTLLYGYGGFEVSLLPGYSGTIGKGWLERGGVYVVANIRGGGEFGPRWHQAALKENRHRAYQDFAAVARDLVKRGVTTHEKLGAKGGSNGGLLMGNMYIHYSELFGAIVCQVPLLDMKRYTKLLAGASWAGEYGDPDDPEQWEFIRTFSPYHNIVATKEYPPILITTSTRDDRVHPGHARKFAHALLEVEKDVLYYENIEGGHGGAANNEQSAFMQAIGYGFLWDVLSGARAARAADAASPDEGETDASEEATETPEPTDTPVESAPPPPPERLQDRGDGSMNFIRGGSTSREKTQ